MDEYELTCRIAEIRSYIASDWPGVEHRKRLYEELKRFEALKMSQSELNNSCSSSGNGSSTKPP